jgi:CBS domain-containing protein
VLVLKRSILTERIARRGHHISREYSIDPFETTRVKDVMVTNVDTLPSTMQIADVVRFFTSHVHRHKSYPVVDAQSRCIGMVSRADVLRWTTNSDHENTLGEALSDKDMIHGWADELVGALADRMAHSDIGRVPILDEQLKLVGLVARKDLLRARSRFLPQEHERTAPLRAKMLGTG